MDAQAWQAGKLSVALQTELQAQPDQPQRIQILLKDRIHPAPMEAQYRRMNLSLAERSAAMIHALRQKAALTQTPVVKTLENLPGVSPRSIKTFWITNLIFCQARPAAIAELSRDSRVEWIDLDWEAKVPDAVESCPAPPVPNGREPGLDAIGAPFMWALGYTGYGTKVLVVDSGNDPQHPAMRQNFAYNYLPLDQAWVNGEQPYFCGDHGTHVGGTIVGLDRASNDTIGVAFGALWQSSAAHFADCQGEARARDFVQIFEWAMDPDGNPATIDDRPDVINNSWSRNLPTNEDCGDPITRAIVDAVYATGIAVVFSASNEGPDDATIGNPPMENWDTLRMFSVGALNGNSSSLLVADFSSRGPTVCGGEGPLAIKPEVSAPGVNVRSCSFDGSYQEKSGTSMAAPHVSGALLLLKEAFPYLEGETLMRALYESSIDLGPTGEDNQYGRGMVYLPYAYQWLLDKGYFPVPPVSAVNDVSLLRLDQLKRSCQNTLESEIEIKNNGLDTLYSLQATVSMAGSTDTLRWPLQLAPGETSTLPLPIFSAPTGQQELVVSLTHANGNLDARRLDNRLKLPVDIFDDELAAVDMVLPLPVCAEGTASVQSLYEGEARQQWFDAEVGGQLIADGPVLALPGLQADTTVYLQIRPRVQVGEAAPLNPTAQASNQEEGLVFDAHYPFTLKSVLVYATQPGGTVIRFDGAGNIGTSELVQIEEAGWQRVPLDFYIPAGEGHRLMLRIGLPLGYDVQAAGFPYPYTLPKVVTIDSSTTGEGEYRYFYDWVIEYDYFCGRSPMTIPVAETTVGDPLSISASASSVDLAVETAAVSFSATPADAVAWQWAFGDGSTSTLPNPTHTYSDTGSYRIQLTVQTAEGCTDAAVFDLQVTDSSPPANTFDLEAGEQLRLYPNPTTDELWLQFGTSSSEEVQLQLLDMLGRPIWHDRRWVSPNRPALMNMRPYPAGAYWLLVQTGQRVITRRVIRIK